MIVDAENRNNVLNDQNKRLMVFQEFINSLPKNIFNRSMCREIDESFENNCIEFDESCETFTESLSFSKESNSSFSVISSAADLKKLTHKSTSNKNSIAKYLLNSFKINALTTAISLSTESLVCEPTSKFFICKLKNFKRHLK